MQVVKKDNAREKFIPSKIIEAIKKAAFRCDREVPADTLKSMADTVFNRVKDRDAVNVSELHEMVIATLSSFGYKDVSESYAEYRYYKNNYARTFEKLKDYADDVLYRGDRENANFDSSLISTKGSLIRGYLAKSLYWQFYLSKREKELCKRGDIYLHDGRDLIFGGFNCCLADFGTVMKGGFEAANIRYSEPKSALTSISLIGDLVLMTSPMQYGGLSVPEIDKIILPYCHKTLKKAETEIREYCDDEEKINKYKWKKLEEELRQGFQVLELKLNSIASARGDYPFSTISFGSWRSIPNRTEEDDIILEMIDKTILKQRIKGHGGLPVVFPKLVYLWDEVLINENKRAASVFDACIECSAQREYPDYLSLTGNPEHNSVAKQFLDSDCKCVVTPINQL